MENPASGLPLLSCPFCGAEYATAARVTIRDAQREALVHVTCAGCRKAMVMAIERTETRLRSVGVMTDCSANDYRRFSHGHRVSLDDVLRVHEGLRREERAQH